MAIKKIQIKPEGSNDYGDVLHPETSASCVIEETNKRFMTDAERTKLGGIATGANNYVHPTTAGNLHIPSGGSLNDILVNNGNGVAKWSSPGTARYLYLYDYTQGIQPNFLQTTLGTYPTLTNTKYATYTKLGHATTQAGQLGDVLFYLPTLINGELFSTLHVDYAATRATDDKSIGGRFGVRRDYNLNAPNDTNNRWLAQAYQTGTVTRSTISIVVPNDVGYFCLGFRPFASSGGYIDIYRVFLEYK